MQIVPYPFTQEGEKIIRNSLIQQQGNVIFPTETYYAVGCLANSVTAVRHVYRIKKRPTHLPLMVLISDWKMFEKYVGKISAQQREVLEKYWPGALTAILPVRGNLVSELNLTGSTLAFRMTSSTIARELIRLVDVPLVGTSANRSGSAEIDDFSDVYHTFGDHIELYIDGGKTPGGLPTTLINMVDTESFTLVRQGELKIHHI